MNEFIIDGEGVEEDRDAYVEYNIFFVPVTARCGYIKNKVKQNKIGKIIGQIFENCYSLQNKNGRN